MENQPFKEARSRIVPANLEEILAAEDSAKWATLQNANQYETPPAIVDEFRAYLPDLYTTSVIDPQCARGHLVTYRSRGWPQRYAMDIDNRIESIDTCFTDLVTTDCQKAFAVLDDICEKPLVWGTFNANPPFAKRWRDEQGEIIDSTDYTWRRALKHGKQGIFITNHKTAVTLGIDQHPFIVRYEVRENLWPDCNVVCGIAVWHNPEAEPTEFTPLANTWAKMKQILEEEKADRPPFNVWLGKDGKLNTYLSTRAETKYRLTRNKVLRLHQIKGSHPLQLTTEVETRRILEDTLQCGLYEIQPAAREAIAAALLEVAAISSPIMPVTDFQRVAYCDELEQLKCVASGGLDLTPGKLYPLKTGTYLFTEAFKRQKVHYNDQENETYVETHDCTLTGQDRYIEIQDDQQRICRFMDKPNKEHNFEHYESRLWDLFERPEVKTIGEVHAAAVEQNKRLLRTCEMMAGFEYYEGQVDYLARVLVKDYALVAAATGTGKSLFAITAIACKAPLRALLVAPQGTMKSSPDEDDEGEEYQASQWVSELRKFSSYLQVFELFSMSDYYRIKSANGGQLPAGVYISYYEALAVNGAREMAPDGWTDAKAQLAYPEFTIPENESDISAFVDSLGREKKGIRCILAPSMATLIGDQFDMVLLDESHRVKGLTSVTTKALIRLQPRYRFAFSATPISNTLTDLFPVLGWLCVPHWFHGDRRNAAFPYAREDYGRFESTFMSKERDLTQEAKRKAADSAWRGKCEKASPVISSPARLLKIVSPTMAFISKESVNPKYSPGRLIDVRVPLGAEQAVLYAHFLNRGNIPSRHPLVRARKQIAYLRGICADPAGFEHGGPRVTSNFNPKTVAILELISSILAKGESVVVVCARVGQTNTIALRLEECGVPYSRIDSTIPADQHAAQSNRFKRGKTRVHLMGIKCAVGHSYSDCPNMIIGSLEYSWGSIDQARGRVDRVNSKKPPTIYCVLHASTLEETIFDVVNTKGDAANICLRGQRIPREFVPVEMGELLAESLNKFTDKDSKAESGLESKWPELKHKIKLSN